MQVVDSQEIVESAGGTEKRKWLVVGLVIVELLFLAGGYGWQKYRLRDEGEVKQLIDDPGELLASRYKTEAEVEKELSFRFFHDVNSNGLKDGNEGWFSDITVSIKREGQSFPFQSLPVDSQGQASLAGIEAGEYEVQFSYNNQMAYQFSGQFNYQPSFEIAGKDGQVMGKLPTEWQVVEFGGGGLVLEYGVSNYQPSQVVALDQGNQFALYDPKYEWVFMTTNLPNSRDWRYYELINDKVFYVNDEVLYSFSSKDRYASEAMAGLYDINKKYFSLSKDGEIVVYVINNQIRAVSKDYKCRERFGFNYQDKDLLPRFGTSDSKVSFLDNQRAVFSAAEAGKNWEVFTYNCINKDQIEMKKTGIIDNQINDLIYLDERRLLVNGEFEVDGKVWKGIYFYDLYDRKVIEYDGIKLITMMGVEYYNNRYIVGLNSRQYVIVDYQAYKQGKEAAYVIPKSNLVSPDQNLNAWRLFGETTDGLLFNETRTCSEGGGVCGEVKKVKFLGNGDYQMETYFKVENLYKLQSILGEISL